MTERELAAAATHLGIRRLLVSAVIAALALASLGAVLIYRVTTGQHFREQAAQNCMAIEAIKGAITLVLNDSLTAVEKRPDLSAAQLVAVRAYYKTQLARFAPADCPKP